MRRQSTSLSTQVSTLSDPGARTSKRQILPLFASAMRSQSLKEDLIRLRGRPDFVSSGLPSLDAALGGGFAVGGLTLVAGPPRSGTVPMLVGTALNTLKVGQRVAYSSERFTCKQMRGRFVVLESRVNGYRFQAGLSSAEDRMALNAARERIHWSLLSWLTVRRLLPREVDAHLFSYRPLLAVVDALPRAEGRSAAERSGSIQEGVQRLASIARKHRVAMLLRVILRERKRSDAIFGDPVLRGAVSTADALVALERHEQEDVGGDDAQMVRAAVYRPAEQREAGHLVALHFDQRFAGLIDPQADSGEEPWLFP